MATGKSGYVEFYASSFYGSQTLRINWSETYDQSTNTSNVTITSLQVKSNTYVGQSYYGNLLVKVNGVTAITLREQNNSVYLNNFNEFANVTYNGTIITGSVNGIAHNTDGSKTVAISIEANTLSNPLFYSATPGNIVFTAGGQNVALTTITRNYTLSISAGAGSSISVTRSGTALPSGSTITYGDVLTITFTAATGYAIATHTVNGSTFTSGGAHTVTGNVTVVSTATAVASTISTGNGTFGTAQTISVTRYNTAYTHTIAYSCSGYNDTIVTQSTNTSISWTPPMVIINGIPSATSATCVLTCTTYSGNTALGTTSITITLSVPASVKPSPSLSVSDAMGYADTYGAYVQGQSKATVSVTDGNQYSASTASRSTTANGTTYTASSFTTGALISSGQNAISTSVTDSRGRTGSASAAINVLAYSAPGISTLSVHRTDSTGAADDNGTYFTVTYDLSITPLNNRNSRSASLWYRPSGGTPTGVVITLSSYSQSGTLGPYAISTDYSYEVEMAVSDDFNTIRRSTTLSTTPSVISFKSGGLGAAFGKAAESDGVLDVAWDVHARKNILLDGTVILSSIPTPFAYGSKVILLPYCLYTDIGSNGTLEDFIDKYLRYIAANYMNQGTNAVYIGTIAYNNTFAGFCSLHMYNESEGTGLPWYCSGLITTPSGISFFNTQNRILTIRSL